MTEPKVVRYQPSVGSGYDFEPDDVPTMIPMEDWDSAPGWYSQADYAKLQARVEELEDKNNRLRDTFGESLNLLGDERDEARAEIKRLREVARRYGRHEANCPFYTSTSSNGSHVCFCGLSEALEEKP